jgi:ribosomal protein S18 acetylase RimI-like enzyme
MTYTSETDLNDCRFLDDGYFRRLYDAFIEAFSDYVVPFALSETQFRNHLNLNAVDLTRSVGCFEGERLIGFSLNGFGIWNGKSSVYDAGTGVIPRFRRRGLSKKMFDAMLPRFQNEGVKQFLLEVIETNTKALSLYERLGFTQVRELALLQRDEKSTSSADQPKDLKLRDIEEPNWNQLTTFWDGNSSWQNSVAAIERSRPMKRIIGAFVNKECVGYIVFSSTFGRIAQLAVDKAHRNRGVGTTLLDVLQANTSEGFPLQVINIDKSLGTTMNFFYNRGFYPKVSQYEMLLQM